MSTTGYSTHQQTRQQLDELDALLQRMLSLPSETDPTSSASSNFVEEVPEAMKAEEFAPFPPLLPNVRAMPSPPGAPVVHAWRVEVPLATPVEPPPSLPQAPPAVTSAPAFSPPPDRRFTAPVPPIPSAGQPSGPPAYPYSMVFGPPVAPQPAEMGMPPMPAAAAPTPTQVFGIPGPQWQSTKPSEPPPIPLLLFPLVLLNGLFDLVTFFLGPLGSWLRRTPGRNVLGWLGVLMILGAIGWGLADWYGIEWTK
jgi:hypothetical protein